MDAIYKIRTYKPIQSIPIVDDIKKWLGDEPTYRNNLIQPYGSKYQIDGMDGFTLKNGLNKESHRSIWQIPNQ